MRQNAWCMACSGQERLNLNIDGRSIAKTAFNGGNVEKWPSIIISA